VLIDSLALAAVLLAVPGVYNVIALSVASRVQEMAIRMALGSPRATIVALVFWSGAKLAAIGCLIGLAGAAIVSELRQLLLYGVSSVDPYIQALAAVAILCSP
jgi:ABC-type lipoprotein release transport system permease subunit